MSYNSSKQIFFKKRPSDSVNVECLQPYGWRIIKGCGHILGMRSTRASRQLLEPCEEDTVQK